MPEFILPYEPIVITSTEGLPREEWLAFRKTGIGGSEVAAVFGISPNISFKVRAQSRTELMHFLLGIYLRQRNQEPLINSGF